MTLGGIRLSLSETPERLSSNFAKRSRIARVDR